MKSTDCNALKLEAQICFPLYAVSRMVTQKYKPLIDQLQLTYPQYLVFLVLWENNNLPVKQLSEKLFLESNTLTPLLKRLEQKQLLTRTRSIEDERQVIISLTDKGRQLKNQAKNIPHELRDELACMDIQVEELNTLKQILEKFLHNNKS